MIAINCLNTHRCFTERLHTIFYSISFNFVCDQYRKCLNSTLGQVKLAQALLAFTVFITLSVIMLSIIMLEIITQSVNILRVIVYFIGLFESLKSTDWESF
jgi:hypothetical protein